MNSKDLNRLLRSPSALMRYQATGKLPDREKPSSPLITLLNSIHPRERAQITGIKIGPELGYAGMRQFNNAAQALNWLSPSHAAAHTPSDSSRMSHFSKRLTIDDLARHALVPDHVADAWNRRHGVRPKRQDEPCGPDGP